MRDRLFLCHSEEGRQLRFFLFSPTYSHAGFSKEVAFFKQHNLSIVIKAIERLVLSAKVFPSVLETQF